MTTIKCLALTSLLLLICSTAYSQDKSQLAFTINEPDLIPEGIAYDRRTKAFYVGSTYLRKIVSIDAKGKVRNFTSEAQDGLRGLVGMRVDPDRGVLWAISSHAGLAMPIKNDDRQCIGCSEVLKYDLKTGELIKKYTLDNEPDQHFLNDLCITPTGDVFITDTIQGSVYVIRASGGELTEFVKFEKTSYPNGIDLSPDKKRIFVALSGKIATVDLATKEIDYLATPQDVKVAAVIDGMYFYKNSLVTIQPFEQGKEVVRYILNAKQDSVERIEIVESANKLHSQPTTGTVVDNDFYYIANSQLQLFRRMYQPDGTFDRSKLSDVVILKVRMR